MILPIVGRSLRANFVRFPDQSSYPSVAFSNAYSPLSYVFIKSYSFNAIDMFILIRVDSLWGGPLKARPFANNLPWPTTQFAFISHGLILLSTCQFR